jgi:hypothetical protein
MASIQKRTSGSRKKRKTPRKMMLKLLREGQKKGKLLRNNTRLPYTICVPSLEQTENFLKLKEALQSQKGGAP